MNEFNVFRNDKPYEHYHKINPQLTRKMYDYLRGNGSLWKIGCGHSVKIKWSNEPPLKEVWYLKTDECYQNRFKQDNEN